MARLREYSTALSMKVTRTATTIRGIRIKYNGAAGVLALAYGSLVRIQERAINARLTTRNNVANEGLSPASGMRETMITRRPMTINDAFQKFSFRLSAPGSPGRDSSQMPPTRINSNPP